jgi:hypothetical protein
MSQTEISDKKTDTKLTDLVAEKEKVKFELAMLQQKLERIESSHHKLEEELHKQEYVNYKIYGNTMKKIQGIVGDVKRYNTWEKFVDESLNNMIIMWREPERMDEIGGDLWNDLTDDMKVQFKQRAAQYYDYMDLRYGIHTKVATMKNEIKVVKAVLSKHKFPEPKNTVLGYYDGKNGVMYPYIHETYNRFFPLKILVTALASMIHKNLNIPGKTSWIDYKEFSIEAFELALEFSDKLKAIKDKRGKNPHRNKRISTGLPIRHTTTKKTEASRERFFNCFIGPKLKSFQWINNSVECNTCKKIFGAHDEPHDFSGKLVLSGALNEMGLVRIREQNGKLEITLSENGFEFYHYKNPIIDEIEVIKADKGEIKFPMNVNNIIEKKVFSKEEKKFIVEKIISKFGLENEMRKAILALIKKEKGRVTNTPEGKEKKGKIDTEIEKVLDTWMNKNSDLAKKENISLDKLALYRMATMGRLAEIGEVEWEIINRESVYSINTK